MDDAPRTLRDRIVLEHRLSQIDDAHVAPLNGWVRELRGRLGSEAIVPWFDPADGGTAARILWLLEAPGPKATQERGGSGIVSCNNNDGTAENTWRTRTEAGVDRKLIAHWNVIPSYLGTNTKIRAWDPTDVAAAGPLLRELVAMFPQLACVVLGGRAAKEAWRSHAPASLDVSVIECPHPSPTNLNTRPAARADVVVAWHRARELSA